MTRKPSSEPGGQSRSKSSRARIVDRPTIGAMLGKVHLAINQRISAMLEEEGYPDVRISAAAVFRGLDRSGTRISVLAQRASLSKQTMGEIVGHLERQGYVSLKVDSEDRRARLVSLTRNGQELAQVIIRCGRLVEEELEKRIGASRMRTLRKGIEEFLDELGSPYMTDWFA